MDEYKEYIYMRRPHYRGLETGDLTAQFELRQKLQCKSFDWFMKEIAFDLPKKYPPVEPPDFAWGEVLIPHHFTILLANIGDFSFFFVLPLCRFATKPNRLCASIRSLKARTSASTWSCASKTIREDPENRLIRDFHFYFHAHTFVCVCVATNLINN